MHKPKLVSVKPMSLHSDWLRDLVSEYFELETWDQTKTYDLSSTLMLRYPGQSNTSNLRSVVDNLWERAIVDQDYVLQNTNWFWYNESLWYKYLGYNQYCPNRSYKKLALMPMRRSRHHRDFLVNNLTSMLDDLIWSYVDHGKQLPDDQDMSNWNSQRHFNPDWYNQTYFSVVAETSVTFQNLQPIFITEKTFKPIAFQHPFLIYGNTGTLAKLQQLGFVTFENLFDESYDSIVDSYPRGTALIQNIKNFVTQPHDAETYRRLAHNHAHFFDTELVKQRIRIEILEPLLHHAET